MTERYIFNRPMSVRQTDAEGNPVTETRLYYNGEPFVCLPLGQLTRGDLTRQEESLGATQNNRFVPTKRHRIDQYGNVIGMMDMDTNGNLTSVEYDALIHTFPVAERLHFAHGRVLTYAAAYDTGFGKVTNATDYNGHAHTYLIHTTPLAACAAPSIQGIRLSCRLSSSAMR